MSLTFDSFVAGVQEKFTPFIFTLADGTEVVFRQGPMLTARERKKLSELYTDLQAKAMVAEGAQQYAIDRMSSAKDMEDLEKTQEVMEGVELPDIGKFYRDMLHTLAEDKDAFKALESALKGLPGLPETYWEELFSLYTDAVGAKGSDLGE